MSHHKNQSLHKNRQNHGTFPTPKRAGDKINYYVLKCRPVINRSSPQVQHDHLQVLLEIESGQRYWMTINVRNGGNDKVLYYLDEDFKHPVTQKILDASLPQGFTKIDSQPGGIALDYVREQLFDFNKMDVLGDGVNDKFDSLEQMLTNQLINALRFDDSRLFVFGSRFDDGARFSSYDLPTGIHDIHMNQGSQPPHKGSNGTYQDGGLLIFFPTDNKWSATFLRFQSQATQTDANGN